MDPIPYPKMLYHPKTGIGTIVKTEAEHEQLLATWAAEAEAAAAEPEPKAPARKSAS